MGGLFGSKAQSTTPTRLNGISINQSLYGNTVPRQYGTGRLPMQLIDYVDFLAKAQTQSQGGKGGGGSATTSYTYSASIVCMLSSGLINGVTAVYKDSTQTTLAALNLTLFKGGSNQAPWSYMQSKHSNHALPYDRTAYVAGANFDLGGQAGLPNLSFEVQGIALWNGGPDSEPSQIITDYSTDPSNGVSFKFLTNLTGTNSYQAYCIAMDFLISPQETTQRQAQEFIREILQLTNSNCVFTPSIGLRIVPYADQPVTGNGVTYTPDLTPEYRFGDADYLYEAGEQPVVEKPVPSNQTFNIWTVEYLNRANQYNIDTESFRDEQDISINGERAAPTVTLHAITRASVALTVATLLCQRNLYVRSSYTFKVRPDFSLLEPMDYVAIDDSISGIVDKLVRITAVEDAIDSDLGEVFTITAEEVLVGPASAPIYDTELAQGYVANYEADPGNVATPYIFTAPPALASSFSSYEEWIAVCGQTGVWGWADVFASLDNITYDHVGVKKSPSRYGTLISTLAAGNDPDTSNQITIQFSGSIPIELDSASRAAADSLRNLCIVDGEIISYQNVTPLGNNAFQLSYLRRGNYGSTISAHAAGSFFAVLDEAIFRMRFDPGLSGQPVWFKFVSANYYGHGVQDISKVPAYQAFFQGQNHGQLLAPGATPLIARGDCVNVGSQIFKKTTGSAAWDSDCYSVDAFTGGCTVRFRPMQTNAPLLVGLNSDPLTDQSYTSLDHAWETDRDGIAYIYENGALALPTRAYTTNDIFEIRYDGKFVTYFISGVQWRAVANPGKSFFMDSSFYSPGGGADNIYFGALNPASPTPYIGRGNAIVGNGGFSKPTGVAAWDSDVYSLEGYPAAHVFFKPNANSFDLALGLGVAPASNSSYTSITAAMDCASNGILYYLVNGSQSTTNINYTSTDLLGVTWDGTNFNWYKNGSIIHTVSGASLGVAAGAVLYMDSSFYNPGSGVNGVDYGPTALPSLTDTAQISANGATETYFAYSSSFGTTTSSSSGFALTVSPLPRIACTCIHTATLDVTTNATTTNVFVGANWQTYDVNGVGVDVGSANFSLTPANGTNHYTVQGEFAYVPQQSAVTMKIVLNFGNSTGATTFTVTIGAMSSQLEFIKR